MKFYFELINILHLVLLNAKVCYFRVKSFNVMR